MKRSIDLASHNNQYISHCTQNMGAFVLERSKAHRLITPMILGAVSLAACMVEIGATAREKKKGTDQAHVVSNIRPGEYSTFTVPGYHSDGVTLSKNLDRHFEQMGTTHYAVHPERGFSLDSIRDEWLKARALDGHRPARIYALSMGGLLVSKLFADKEFRDEFGQVDKLVLDSAFSGKKDLSVATKIAMGFGALLPVTYSTSQFYKFVSEYETHEEPAHSEEVTEEEARARFTASSKMHFSAGKDEILFMHHNSVDQLPLNELGNQIQDGVTYLQAPYDKLINTERSSQVYSDNYETEVECRIDTNRPHGSHAAGPEFPKSAIDALLDQNHDSYRIKTLRPSQMLENTEQCA